MSKQIVITVDQTSNPTEVFNLLQQLGAHSATLTDHTIEATVADNLVNPLRSVQGVINVKLKDETSSEPTGNRIRDIPRETVDDLEIFSEGFPVHPAFEHIE